MFVFPPLAGPGECSHGCADSYEERCCYVLQGPKTRKLGWFTLGVRPNPLMSPHTFDSHRICDYHSIRIGSSRAVRHGTGFAVGKETSVKYYDLPDEIGKMSLSELSSFPRPSRKVVCDHVVCKRHRKCGGFVLKRRGDGYCCSGCGRFAAANHLYPAHLIVESDASTAIQVEIDSPEDEDLEDEQTFFLRTFQAEEALRIVIAWRTVERARLVEEQQRVLENRVFVLVGLFGAVFRKSLPFVQTVDWFETALAISSRSASCDIAFSAETKVDLLDEQVGAVHYQFKVRMPKIKESDRALDADVPDFGDVEQIDAATKVGSEVNIKRPRTSRGGKRVMAKQPGLCYLKFVPKKFREVAKEELGYRPQIKDVAEAFEFNGVKPRNNRIEVVPGGAHVKAHKGWPAALQWSILTKEAPQMRIGAEDWDDFAEDVVYELRHKIDTGKMFDLPSAPGVDFFPQDPVCVKGSGDCWKACGMYFIDEVQAMKEDEMNLTVEKFIECYQNIQKKAVNYAKQNKVLLVKYNRQEDGDWHISDAKFDVILRNKNGAIGKRRAQEGWKEIEDMIVDVEGEPHKLVAAPATSALDAAIASLVAPDVRSAMERLVQPQLRDGLDAVARLCPYKIPVKNQHKAEELGIPFSKYNTIDHPHPLHAAMRRWAYNDALPKYIKCDTTFVGMKKEHFDVVKRAVDSLHGEGTYKMSLVNPIVDLKDVGRYAGTGTVPESVWDLPVIETSGVHFDESGHYLSPHFMLMFRYRNPKVRVITMSNIFPLLSLKYDQSPEPEYVNWRIQKTTRGSVLIYIPEEDEGGKYEQPYDPTMTLLSKVEAKDGSVVWNGGVVEKKGNLRIQAFYAYNVKTPDFVVECEYSMMDIPRVFRNQPPLPPIRTDHFIKMVQYGKVLPAAKKEVQWGKLRTFAQDKKTYFDVGAMEWLVKVVMEVVQIETTASLQSKVYDNVSDELYYKTIGHLIRSWQGHFSLRYANRNRRLVANPDPVKIWPTIRAEVDVSDDGSVYGTAWRSDAEVPSNFWDHLKLWVKSLVNKELVICDQDLHVTTDLDGRLVFPFLANSYYNRRVYGTQAIKESQRRDYLLKFEDWVAPVENPLPPRDEALVNQVQTALGMKLENDSEDDLPSEPETLPPLDDNLSDDDSEGTVISSGGESDESDDTVVELPPGKYEFEPDGPVRHCESCPTYQMCVYNGMKPDFNTYDEYCLGLHELRMQDSAPALQELRKAALDRTYLREKRKIFSSEDFISPASAPAKNPKTRVFIDDEILHRQITDQRLIMEKDVLLAKPSYMHPDSFIEAKEKKEYDKRKAAFERLYLGKPTVATHAHQAVGSTLWDLMYPTTVDCRWNKIPYKNVVEFPNVKYPENDCLLVAMADGLGKTTEEVFYRCLRAYPAHEMATVTNLALSVIDPVTLHYGVECVVRSPKGVVVGRYGVRDAKWRVELELKDGHLTCVSKKPALVIRPKQIAKMGSPTQMKLISNMETWQALQWHDWTPEPKRALDLVRAMIAGTTGLLGTPLNMDQLKAWESSCDNPPKTVKKMAVIMGDPGCRKSSFPQKILKRQEFKKSKVFTAILPTSGLAQDWRDKIDAPAKDPKNKRAMPGECVTTFEKALAYGHTANLVITDENKFQKGYHALYHIVNPEARYHIFLCDPWQTSWHEPNTECLLNSPDIMGEAELYKKYASMYLIGTWRLPAYNANFWRMPSFSKKKGGFFFSNVMPTQWTDLKAHFPNETDSTVLTLWDQRHEYYAAHFDTVWAEQLRASEANSFAGSQGLTCSLAIIEIDERVLRGVDPRMIYTPMTRSQYILFVYKFTTTGRMENYEAAHPVFSKLRHYHRNYALGRPVPIHPDHTLHIRDVTSFLEMGSLPMYLAGPPEKLVNWEFVKDYYPPDLLTRYMDPDAPRAGARLRRDEPSYIDRPDFQHFIDEHEEYYLPGFGLPEPISFEPKLPTLIPPESREAFEEEYKAFNFERYSAELMQKGEYSHQLPDELQTRKDSVQVMQRLVSKENVPRRQAWLNVRRKLSKMDPYKRPDKFMPDLYNWGLDQKSTDTVSFLAARQQRIRYATVQENLEQLHDHETFGMLCWESFKAYMGWTTPEEFDQLFYDQSVEAFQFRRGDRSEALKKMSLNRADPDFGMLMTAKTQWKLKERISTVAKPLQPVMVHADSYLFKFGPWGIYLLDKVLAKAPDYWYFHAKRTPEDFAAWVERHFKAGDPFSMNDQKGQDQAVQGWAVVFFMQLMEFFGVPVDVIEDFKKDKTMKEVNGKIMAIMTDSGEVWTYLINTLSSAARECAMFGMPPGFPMACGGDDIMRAQGLSETFAYKQVRHLDPTIDKRYDSDRGDFCSFIVKKGRLFKDPVILLKRFLGKLSAGKGDDAALGYFHLWAFNYRQSEHLFECFDEDELKAHAILTRLMMNLKKEGIRVRPDWSLLRLDGEVQSEWSVLDIMENVPPDILTKIEEEAKTPAIPIAGLSETSAVYSRISDMLTSYGEEYTS